MTTDFKPTKYNFDQTNKIDLGNKIIYKYPTPTFKYDIAKMVVNGRHPVDPDTFLVEHACEFIMYILSGEGIVQAGDDKFNVKPGDTVFVPKDTKFAVEGKFVYITVDVPAFYLEQSEEVKI